MSERPGDCTTKDIRCLFLTFLLIWIFSIATFGHEIKRQTQYERTTGTVIGGSNHPVIQFSIDGKDITFMSDVKKGPYDGPYQIGTDDIIVVYNAKYPSKDPEILEISHQYMIFAGSFALFTTQIAICLIVYVSCTRDSLSQGLGLSVPFVPTLHELEYDDDDDNAATQSDDVRNIQQVELAVHQNGIVA